MLSCLLLAGCFTPLYGPRPGGGTVNDVMAAIEVGSIQPKVGQDRIAHYLRNELVFDLDGSGRRPPKRYKLDIGVTEGVSAIAVNSTTGTASSAMIIATATFTLRPYDGGETLFTGTATASASYDRGSQRFASLRAARDAEIRAARLLAEQIQTRLAATIATRS